MAGPLDLYGQRYRPNWGSDAKDYTTADDLDILARNQDYGQSMFGKVAAWLDGAKSKPNTLPDDAPLGTQAAEAGNRILNLPRDMLLDGAKTATHWLGATEYPEKVEPVDMLAPLGLGAMAGLAGVVPRGAVGSAGGKLAGALDMSNEARMARAKEMGFDTDTTWYHGTNQPLDEIRPGMRDPGAWFTTDINNAANYARGTDAQVYNTYLKSKNPFIVSAGDDGAGGFKPFHKGRPLDIDSNVGIVKEGFNRGHDSVFFEDGNFSESGPTMVVRDGNQIRGRDAAFDPAKADSANLLAADQARGSAVGMVANALDEPRGITAYHGSPHDFDRFSMDKIGTGEGAQAYGHGLYFAENEGVAKSYKAAGVANMDGRAAADAYIDALKKWTADGRVGEMPTPESVARGRMYEVRINADPEDFLDWDKTLSQQSEKVRGAVAPIAKSEASSELERWAAQRRMTDIRVRQMGMEPGTAPPLRSVDDLTANMTPDMFAKGREDELRALGIPGIRYLDQGSRNAGEGSRNYVLFRDDIIDIVKKYGIAAAASMYGMQAVDDAMAGDGS